MKIEDRIKEAAATKVRVTITGKKRNKHGFAVMASDGTITTVKAKSVALQILFAVVRCQPVRIFTIKAIKPKNKN